MRSEVCLSGTWASVCHNHWENRNKLISLSEVEVNGVLRNSICIILSVLLISRNILKFRGMIVSISL